MSNDNALPTLSTELPDLPPRDPATHKGRVGRVSIVAGSRGMSGAAVLAASGALRGGAGLVRVYTPGSMLPVIAAGEPCLMTVALPEDGDGTVATPAAERIDLDWTDALAIGPGLGQRDAVGDMVATLVGAFGGPTVIDADGLNTLATRAALAWSQRRDSRASPAVLTPHPGEITRLLDGAGLTAPGGQNDEERLHAACTYARWSEQVVLLKGHRTIVTDGTRAYVNTTGNPGMATGGMGDVLTGLIAALLGQGLGPFDAARLAAYVHGLAGDRCARRIGPVGYLARDLAEQLPAARHEATRPRIGFR